MRALTAFFTVATLLAGCGSSGSRPAGSACRTDGECAQGLVCEGCPGQAATCLVGCRGETDCAPGQSCTQPSCLTCPCPAQCG